MTTRRRFIYGSAAGIAGLATLSRINATAITTQTAFVTKPAEEMRPGEIIKAITQKSVAYLPVSPMLEWHSYHLPMGTDALICEAIAREMAAITGGIWFRPLSFGLDAYRTNPIDLEQLGFKSSENVYGMNFPDLPLASEYCNVPEFKAAVINRLNFLERSGVKHVFLINHHGGVGQFDTIEQLAKQQSSEKLSVRAIKTYDYNKLTPDEGFFHTGGHAGYSETLWLQAFRPDLVDLNELPTGSLNVRKTGILHDKPEIEPQWNPRNIKPEVAIKLRINVLNNLKETILTII